MIISFIATLIASLTVLPLLSFIVLYILLYAFLKEKKEALQWSIYVTSVLLFISVHITIQELFDFSLLWLLLLLVIAIGGGLTYLQFSVHGAIRYDKLIKGIFRLSFLLFLPIHLLLYLWVFISSFTFSLFS